MYRFAVNGVDLDERYIQYAELSVNAPGNTVWACGSNGYGQLGLGASISTLSSLTQIPISSGWAGVGCGNNHSIIASVSADIWSFGDNQYGQLGLGHINSKLVPTQITNYTFNWPLTPTELLPAYTPYLNTEFSAYDSSFILFPDGMLWVCGDNQFGQLGKNNITNYSVPTFLGSTGSRWNWRSVSCGIGHSLAVNTEFSLYVWGNNAYGQLGTGNTSSRSTPSLISYSFWKSVSAGFIHSIATKADGTMWSWGGNDYGQLGLGDSSHRSSPTQIGGGTSWSKINAGGNTSLAIDNLNKLWSWGENTYGQLGQTNTTHLSSPKQVGALTNWSQVQVGCDQQYTHVLAIKTDGTLWSWGNNLYGKLGQGNTTNLSSPKIVGALTTWVSIAAGSQHSICLLNNA